MELLRCEDIRKSYGDKKNKTEVLHGISFSLEKGHTSYTSNLGTPALRREVCRYVEKNYHVSYNPDNECIITIGVSEKN